MCLDEACSKVSLKGYQVPENLKQLEQAVKELDSQKEESIERGRFCRGVPDSERTGCSAEEIRELSEETL